MSHSDVIRTARNYLAIGAFSKVMRELHPFITTDVDASVLYFRAAMEVDLAAVPNALANTTSLGERSVSAYATYRLALRNNQSEEKQKVIDQLTSYQADSDMVKDAHLNTILALIHINERNYRDALRSLHLISPSSSQSSALSTQEKLALTVHCYLVLDRVDLAEQCVEQMQTQDDDDPYTVLASVWVQIMKRKAGSVGDANASYNTASELVERYGETPLLLTTLGTVRLAQNQFREAFQLFKQSRELANTNKEIVSAETLINSMVCAYHLGGASAGTPSSAGGSGASGATSRADEIIQAIYEELNRLHPYHPYLLNVKEMEQSFDRCAAQYASSTKGVASP